jgi:hypothetical protein
MEKFWRISILVVGVFERVRAEEGVTLTREVVDHWFINEIGC